MKNLNLNSFYEDILPKDSSQRSNDYEPISDDEDWLSNNSEMERELFTTTNKEEIDAMMI